MTSVATVSNFETIAQPALKEAPFSLPQDLAFRLAKTTGLTNEVEREHLDPRQLFLDGWRSPDLFVLRDLLKEPMAELFQLPLIARLEHVYQMAECRFTVHGKNLSHSRLLHMVEVMQFALSMCFDKGLDLQQACEVGFAALLHDVGHSPFSHSGELALQRQDPALMAEIGLQSHFDHEKYGQHLIHNSDIAKVLRRHGVNPDRVASILDPEHPFHAYVDNADRAAWVRRDALMSTDFTREQRAKIAKSVDKFLKLFSWQDGKIVLGDADPMYKILGYRSRIMDRCGHSPAALVAKQVVREQLDKLISSGKCSVAEFVRMNDAQALELFDAQARKVLTQGVERHWKPIVAWSLKYVKPEAISFIQSSTFEGDIQRLLDRILPGFKVHTVVTPLEHKKVQFNYRDHDRTIRDGETYQTSNERSRMICIVGMDDQLKDYDLSRARRILTRFFKARSILTADAQPRVKL